MDPARVKIMPDGRMITYTEHFPPDTAAAFIWLKNRQPHRWRDKKEVSATADVNETQHPAPQTLTRALAHVEELSRLLLGDDDEPETTDGVLIEGRQADERHSQTARATAATGAL